MISAPLSFPNASGLMESQIKELYQWVDDEKVARDSLQVCFPSVQIISDLMWKINSFAHTNLSKKYYFHIFAGKFFVYSCPCHVI